MKVLSKHNIVLKVLMPTVLVIVLFLILLFALDTIFISLVFLMIGFLWIMKAKTKVYNIYFDDNNLILKNNFSEKFIEFDKIVSLKLSLNDIKVLGFQFNEYVVEFNNEKNQKDTISFFINIANNNLQKFQDFLNEKYPEIKIENYARSWK